MLPAHKRTDSISSWFTLWRISILLAVILSLIGRTASASDSTEGKKPRALVIGTPAGIVYEAIADRFKVTSGSGQEDPSAYDLVVFDGNGTSPEALHDNPATANFLRAGKAVVILNNTEDHRRIGLNHLLWAHAQGGSPAVAFFIPRDRRGVPRLVVQIDFPFHLNANGTITTTPPTADDIREDAQTWLDNLRSRLRAALRDAEPNAREAEPNAQDAEADAANASGSNLTSGSSGNGTPTNGTGQTALTIDDVGSGTVTIPSAWGNDSASYVSVPAVNNAGNPNAIAWCTGTNVSSCNQTTTTPPHVPQSQTVINFENTVSVNLVPPNGSTPYLHQIIARQYLNTSPETISSTGYMECDAPSNSSQPPGTVCTVYSLLGFNALVYLEAYPLNFPASGSVGSLVVTMPTPEAANNTTTLTTTQEWNESVGLSASAGYAPGASGSIGANWSETWGWEQSTSVNIMDWSSKNSVFSSGTVLYTYQATGGTNDTYSNLIAHPYNNGDCNQCLLTAPPVNPETQLNALQQSGMTSQSETDYTSHDGPVPPGQYTLTAYDIPNQGEAYTFESFLWQPLHTPNSYGNIASPASQPGSVFSLDFTDPTLQPPAEAPWTLNFGSYGPSTLGSGYVQYPGKVTLSSAATSDTTINLTYVVEPENSLLSPPGPNTVCPGNTTFAPGPTVVSNGSGGSPPLTITIPAGQTEADFNLTLQTFASNNYNVQVVAWQPTGNLQALSCLTSPNS